MDRPLRPYQIEACDAIDREWGQVRSTMLVLATGLGKTRVGSEVIRRRLEANTGRVLWVAHRDELITQARDAITENVPGIRVGIEKAGQFANTYALHDMHDHVVVASVQTLHEKRRQRFAPHLFGTLIIDEGHHATARTYREIMDHFPDAKVLLLTATPDRGDGVGMGEVADSVAYEMGIQRGIESGFLCPIKVLAINVHGLDLSSVKTTAGDLNQGQLARILESDEVHHEIASPLAEHIGTRQAVVFCASVAQSKALADVIQGYLPSAQIRHVDGSTPEMERRRILGEYARGEAQVICNCAVLTEGFDAPNTSLIALARPTKSRALYAQMVGRGTRLAPGKTDCLVLDFRGNAGRHSLANPLDLLAGRPLSDDVKKELAKREKDGKVLDLDAIAETEEEVAKRIREEEAKRARQAAIRVKAQYAVARMDAFYSEFEPPNRSHDTRPATDRQVSGLEKFGVDRDKAENMTFRQASDMLDRLTKRARDGMATYKQSRWLAKQGIRFDIPKSVAAQIMDAAANDHWRVPQWAREKYGVAS